MAPKRARKPRAAAAPRTRGVALQRGDVDLDALVRRLVRAAKGRAGAVTAFAGFVRSDRLGRGTVRAIDYEAYAPMARAQLARIRAAAVARFGLLDARIVHRTGRLRVGQPSVFVACAAEHRAATQEAAAWIMDEVKRSVPLWKRERGARGETRWVDGHAPHEPGGAALPEARLPFG